MLSGCSFFPLLFIFTDLFAPFWSILLFTCSIFKIMVSNLRGFSSFSNFVCVFLGSHSQLGFFPEGKQIFFFFQCQAISYGCVTSVNSSLLRNREDRYHWYICN